MLKYVAPVFDMEALQAIEGAYRERIDEEPVDTGARLRLAWCLVLRAVHEAGREAMAMSVVTAAAAAPGTPVWGASAAVPAGCSNDAKAVSAVEPSVTSTRSEEYTSCVLLKNCLQQATMVLQLSTVPEEKHEAARLRDLIQLSGARQAIIEADEEADKIVSDITHAILQDLHIARHMN